MQHLARAPGLDAPACGMSYEASGMCGGVALGRYVYAS